MITEFEVDQEIVIQEIVRGGGLFFSQPYEIRKVVKCDKDFVYLDNEEVYSLQTRKKKGTDEKRQIYWELSSKSPDEVRAIIEEEFLRANRRSLERLDKWLLE